MTLAVNHLVGFGVGAVEASGPWTPAQLFAAGQTGCWFDVSDLSTLFVERTGGGTTPASVNGPVGTVRDKSGGGFHWQALTDSGRPTLRQSGPRYYLEFDGVDDVLWHMNASSYQSATMDVFLGVRFTGATGGVFFGCPEHQVHWRDGKRLIVNQDQWPRGIS